MGLFTVIIGAHDKQILREGGKTTPYRWYHALADSVYGWWATRDWRRRSNEFQRTGTRYYGDGGTIHQTGHLDIGVHRGRVVSVWFRCQPLPFKQNDVDLERANDMDRMYADAAKGVELHGVEVRP